MNVQYSIGRKKNTFTDIFSYKCIVVMPCMLPCLLLNILNKDVIFYQTDPLDILCNVLDCLAMFKGILGILVSLVKSQVTNIVTHILQYFLLSTYLGACQHPPYNYYALLVQAGYDT